jgi:N-acyl homoserine lactone hydrolase
MKKGPFYKIHPFVVGTKVFDKGMMTYQHDYGKEYVIPIYCWLIEGSDKVILIDTGLLDVIQSEFREQAIGGKIYKFEEGLAKWGLSPKDIDIVIHTHLHNDHCENDFKCVNAVFYAHELEFQSAYNPHPLDFRYLADFIEEVDQAGQMIHIKNEVFEVVPGITMVHTPAHTKGGISVLINTEKGLAGITGFCVIMENFNPPNKIKAMGMEVIPPGTNIDPYLAYDQMIKFREMVDILIPLHEPSFSSVETIP